MYLCFCLPKVNWFVFQNMSETKELSGAVLFKGALLDYPNQCAQGGNTTACCNTLHPCVKGKSWIPLGEYLRHYIPTYTGLCNSCIGHLGNNCSGTLWRVPKISLWMCSTKLIRIYQNAVSCSALSMFCSPDSLLEDGSNLLAFIMDLLAKHRERQDTVPNPKCKSLEPHLQASLFQATKTFLCDIDVPNPGTSNAASEIMMYSKIIREYTGRVFADYLDTHIWSGW